MTERHFHLRSRARHSGDQNDLARLELELELEGAWQPVALCTTTPPFRAFVCTALMCQHAYLRMNAAECGLVLGEVQGELWMATDEWLVGDVRAHFRLQVLGGKPSDADLALIAERTRDCPISRNLSGTKKNTTLEIAS